MSTAQRGSRLVSNTSHLRFSRIRSCDCGIRFHGCNSFEAGCLEPEIESPNAGKQAERFQHLNIPSLLTVLRSTLSSLICGSEDDNSCS